ncbi:hypothetical protein ABIC80_000567 [Kosakonia sp. 1610]
MSFNRIHFSRSVYCQDSLTIWIAAFICHISFHISGKETHSAAECFTHDGNIRKSTYLCNDRKEGINIFDFTSGKPQPHSLAGESPVWPKTSVITVQFT